ncbi:hypothetical protein D3C72_1424630 [compost metagenome]
MNLGIGIRHDGVTDVTAPLGVDTLVVVHSEGTILKTVGFDVSHDRDSAVVTTLDQIRGRLITQQLIDFCIGSYANWFFQVYDFDVTLHGLFLTGDFQVDSIKPHPKVGVMSVRALHVFCSQTKR